MRLVQINLQTGFGGGEVYTQFFSRALAELGIAFDLVVRREARWWRDDALGAARVLPVAGAADIAGLGLAPGSWLICHAPERADTLAALRAAGLRLASFVHMPLHGRSAAPFAPYERLFAVSAYVRDGLRAAGLEQVHPEPLYGVAHLARGAADTGVVRAGPLYDFDRRKLRDRLLDLAYPAWRAVAPRRRYRRRPGLTLGVVSRLTPIKQFPLLLRHLAPRLRAIEGVHVEVFGSGGFASVRDLRRAAAPLAGRIRYWGQQRDMRAVYGAIDLLVTGLPEKEALGLNVIEAQACGVAVLAPAAPPFTETVADGRSGFLYRDPREDAGADFARIVGALASGAIARPDPRAAADHLARFSAEAFRERVGRALAALAGAGPPG